LKRVRIGSLVLGNLPTKIRLAILVSGFAYPLEGIPEASYMLQVTYNWKKIAENVENIIIINSDNDPWLCNDSQGRYISENLGKGMQIIMRGEGHMGSERFNQPYREFPLLLNLVDLYGSSGI